MYYQGMQIIVNLSTATSYKYPGTFVYKLNIFSSEVVYTMCRSRRGFGPSLENSNLLDLQSKITENMPQTRFSGSGHVHNYIVHVCIAFNVFNRYWKNLQVKFLSHSGQQLIRGKWVFSLISLMLWLLFNMCLVNFEDKKKFD